MATSDSVDFTLNRNQIIYTALWTLGVLGYDETPTDDLIQIGNRWLNIIVKAWVAEGSHIWERKEGILFLQNGQNQYSLGVGGDRATNSYVSTTVFSDTNASVSTIVLTSVTGMSVNDYIGIEDDDQNREWFTISAINTGTKTITFTGGTLATTSAAGSTVVTYTTGIQRPLAVVNARRFNLVSAMDIPTIALNHTEYYELVNKTTPGLFNSFYYDAKLGDGQLSIWLEPNEVQDICKFTYYNELMDFDTASDTPDFPTEWLQALIFGLAVAMAPTFEKYQQIPVLKQMAIEARDSVEEWDNEFTSIKFTPRMKYR